MLLNCSTFLWDLYSLTGEMRNYGDLSDEELLILFQDENVAVFEALYNRYWSVMYSAAYRRVQSREIAQEIVQNVFTSLWVNRRELRIQSSLQAYLLSAVKYKVINHFEKEMVRRSYSEQLLATSTIATNFTEETILFEDLTAQLEEELANLPPRCREVFQLSRREFKTNKEIAEQLGISEKTVENQLTKALKILKSGLREIISLLVFLQF